MLQVYVLNVSAVSNIRRKCFMWILYMLHWLYMYVTSICFKYFSCFKHILIVFYLHVAYVAVAIHMLQACVAIVSSVLDVCCSKCFMLQVFYEQTQEGGCKWRWSPLAQQSRVQSIPDVHAYRSSGRMCTDPGFGLGVHSIECTSLWDHAHPRYRYRGRGQC
jgi:hypothetical protein